MSREPHAFPTFARTPCPICGRQFGIDPWIEHDDTIVHLACITPHPALTNPGSTQR